jgi:putative aldouronate transport system substrate-binding protein
MKKTIAIIISIMLVMAITFPAAAISNTVKNTKSAVVKPVKLVYYTPGNGQPIETNLVEAAMNKILTSKINATIKLNFISWGDYSNKMNVLVASGASCDICFSAGWMNYGTMTAKGAYADLTTLLPKYAPEYIAEVPSYVIDSAKFKGKLYAAPNLQGLAYAPKLFVNSRIFDKYKLPSKIKSMNELDTYMDAIKNGESGMTPFYGYTGSGALASFGYIMNASPLYIMGDQQSVGQYNGTNFKVVNQYESDTAKEWYTWARKAYQKGWISKGAATQKNDDNLLKSEKFAMEFSNSCPQYDASNWGLLLPVTFKSIDLGIAPRVTTGSAISTMLSISQNSKNKEKAMMYINLINTDKALYNTLCYGVEGRHYTVKDGFVDLPKGVTADKLGYNPGSNWAFGFTYNAYLAKGTDPEIGTKQLAFDKAATAEPAMGFTFDATAVKTELANTQSVLEEFAPALESGALDPVTGLAEMIEKLKAAGSEKIIAEKQKQLDKWRTDNGK